jgi:hypothetical protein
MAITLTSIQKNEAGQDPMPFFVNNPNISFQFTNLDYWQLQQLRKFSAAAPLTIFSDYGFNGETQKGRGVLKVSRLKIWSGEELASFEEIMGISWQQFSAYL